MKEYVKVSDSSNLLKNGELVAHSSVNFTIVNNYKVSLRIVINKCNNRMIKVSFISENTGDATINGVLKIMVISRCNNNTQTFTISNLEPGYCDNTSICLPNKCYKINARLEINNKLYAQEWVEV
jgi:hypothetical protein